MNNPNELFEQFKNHGLGDIVDIIGKLAMQAFAEASKSTEPTDDRLLTPTQAAKELGVSWQTLRNKWGPKYGIKHSGHTGKDRRYRMSEINRVKVLIMGDD